jgi:choline dehydrogenase-like flavoprotein
MRTGNCTIVTDAVVHSLIHDPKSGKVTGVRVIDSNTKKTKTYKAKLVFLCASTIPTAQILLNSKSEAAPRGLGNSSDMVGRNLMDHFAASAAGLYPGLESSFYRGRRPTGFYIPRFRNVTEPGEFLRGYGFQGGAARSGWGFKSKLGGPGVGAQLKENLRKPGGWLVYLSGFGEMLPNRDNRVTLHPTKIDQWGIPQAHIECIQGENEIKAGKQMIADAKAMIEGAGGRVIQSATKLSIPGDAIHEMGTACMGRDPANSVLNGYNQVHNIPNLFVTDGSAMASGGCQNPSLTYMALSARAAHHAVEFLKAGKI